MSRDGLGSTDNMKNTGNVPRSVSPSSGSEARKELGINDVISICSKVAADENIMVTLPPTKREQLRRFSNDLLCMRRKSDTGHSEGSYSLSRWKSEQQMRKFNDELSKFNQLIVGLPIILGVKNENHLSVEYIPGKNRASGGSTSSLAESGDATQYLDLNTWRNLSKSDSYVNKAKSSENVTAPQASNTRSLSDILDKHLTVDKANKLKKRMRITLLKFHTTDLTTAFSFLKLNRYAHVRQEIKEVLLDFVEQDLKMKNEKYEEQ